MGFCQALCGSSFDGQLALIPRCDECHRAGGRGQPSGFLRSWSERSVPSVGERARLSMRGDLRPRLPFGGQALFIKDRKLHYYNFRH